MTSRLSTTSGERSAPGSGTGESVAPGFGSSSDGGAGLPTATSRGVGEGLPANRPDPGPPGAGVQAVQQPGSGLGLIISLAVAAVVFVLAIYAIGDPEPDRVPLAQTTDPLFWIVGGLAVLAAGAGAQYAERTAARAAAAVGRTRSDSALATAWTVPALATAAAVLLIATYHNAAMLVAGPLLAFLGNAGAILARDLLDDAADSSQRTATTIHTLVIHTVAFLALSAVYLNKLSTPVSAFLIAVVGGLLTLETLERGSAGRTVRLLYALLAAGVMAQATIAVNWWQTHGWTGGAVLLVCFYLVAGVLLARTQRTVLQTRDVIEFGLVSLVAFVVLAVTA